MTISSFSRRALAIAMAIAFTATIGGGPAAACNASPSLGGSPSPYGTTQCPGVVRPGAAHSTHIGGCSFNFLFQGSDGYRYIGTAGHCLTAGGEVIFDRPGPAVGVSGRRVGEAAYAINQGARDFGLVRLDHQTVADPAMIHFGGPTGMYTDHSVEPMVLRHYGKGTVVGGVLPARTALAINTNDPWRVPAYGVVLWGDSGSGVIDSEGRAVGVAVTLTETQGVYSGTMGISRLDRALYFAEINLGVELELLTAPLA